MADTVVSDHAAGGARGELAFRDVSFRYSQGETVLEHIDLAVPANSVIAAVGPTGVGKTTLVSLIPRFDHVCDGAIGLDGHDIRDLTLRSPAPADQHRAAGRFPVPRHGAGEHPLRQLPTRPRGR